MSKKRLLENIFSLGALQAANYALPLLLLPYLAHTLGVEKLGLLAFAISLMQLFSVLIDYGFNLSASRQAAVHRNEPTALNHLFAAVTTLRITFASAGLLLLYLLIQTIPRLQSDANLYLASYILVAGNALFPLWLFQGIERMKLASIIQIGTKFTGFIATILLVKSPDDVVLAAFLQGSTNLAAAFICLPLVPGAIGATRIVAPKLENISQQLKEGWHIFLSSAAINLYTSSNVFILGALTNPSTAGIYHVAEKTVRAVQYLFEPINQAVYPYISKLAQYNTQAALDFNQKMLKWAGAASLLSSISLAVTAPWIVPLLFSPDFSASVEIIQAMAPLPFIIVISNIIGKQKLLAFGFSREFSRIIIRGAGLNFATFPLMAHFFGALGAALANVATEAVIAIFFTLKSRKINFLKN